MRSKTGVLLLSSLATIASAHAFADNSVTVQTEIVKYDDVRLISAVGAAVLYGRIRNAAEKACGAPQNKKPIEQEARFRQCVDDAVAKAVVQVNEPVLTWYHDSKKGRATGPAPTDQTAVARK
jgi:UrcA family protein